MKTTNFFPMSTKFYNLMNEREAGGRVKSNDRISNIATTDHSTFTIAQLPYS